MKIKPQNAQRLRFLSLRGIAQRSGAFRSNPYGKQDANDNGINLLIAMAYIQ
jgi:hypothetical protein